MAQEKVLVLQGPLRATGINPVTQNVTRDTEARRLANLPFDACATTHALAYVFRVQGYKVIYSGWNEDAEWLQANSELFDQLLLSDQGALRSYDVRGGTVLPNSKQKMYYGALRGLQAAHDHYGADAMVLRLRSDVCVDFNLALREFVKLRVYPKAVLIEYMRTDMPYSMPDFMNMGQAATLLAVYRHLYQLTLENRSYHVSSHVDHGLAYMYLQEQGVIAEMLCMERALYDSAVWRGVPRYMENVFAGHDEHMFFGGMVARDPAVKVSDVLALVPPELSGRDPAVAQA